MPSDPEIIGPDDNSHSIDVYALPPTALRAILDKLNEKSQTATKLYNGKYKISLNDIEQFIAKIDQEFHACTVLNRSATATLILSEQRRFDFRSWEEFLSFDTSQKGRTASLQVELNYSVFRGKDKNLESYGIQLSIQNLSESGSMGILFGPIVISQPGAFPVPPSSIFCTIKYNNYILGKNIVSSADGWVGSLDIFETPILKKAQKNSDKIREIIFFFATISGMFVALGLHKINVFSHEQWIIYGAMTTFSFAYVGRVIGKWVEYNIDRISVRDPLCITRGDNLAASTKKRANTRYMFKVFLGIIAFFVQARVRHDQLESLGFPTRLNSDSY